MDRTHRWAKRSILAHKQDYEALKKQGLYGVVQGGRFVDLRQESARVLGDMDRITSYNVCYTKLLRFFFGLMAGVAFMVASMLRPFVSALALSAIIVTICYPLYRRILVVMPRRNETLAALVTTLSVIVIIFAPLFVLMSRQIGVYMKHAIIQNIV